MTTKAPWFGTILDWIRDPQTGEYRAWHGERSWTLTKHRRRNGAPAGWYLWDERDHARDEVIVGATLPAARRNADARILCGDYDVMGWPQLGVALDPRAGRIRWTDRFGIRLDEPSRWFYVTNEGDAIVGTVKPHFRGAGSGMTVVWVAAVYDVTLTADSWNGLFAELATELAAKR